jgi:hypothetical protein
VTQDLVPSHAGKVPVPVFLLFFPVLFSCFTRRELPLLFDGDSTHHTRYARPLFPSCYAKLSTQSLI